MTTTMVRPPSPKSIEFLTDLVRNRDVSPGKTATQCLVELTHWLAKPKSQQEVSAMIDRSKTAPRRMMVATSVAGSYAPYPSVPEGVPSSKSAILSELLVSIPDSWLKQEYLFFEVKQLRGRRVVRRLTGAPGAFSRTNLPAALASELFGHLEKQEIAYAAALKFGELFTVCGRCSAPLTDDKSRSRHFGPICWELMGAHRVAFEAAS